jgi:cyclopropane-fatty-acyl-phospholipid synthase
MPTLTALIDLRLAQLLRSLTVEWPVGWAGAAAAQARLGSREYPPPAWLARGEVGQLAQACAKGRAAFDRIALIGRFEPVGRARLGRYFARFASLLKPGGLAPNHGISAGGLRQQDLGAGTGDFIERHSFPGGELLPSDQMAHNMAGSRLELLDAQNLRPQGARTLLDGSAALDRQLDSARDLTSESIASAYCHYLAGNALCFQFCGLLLFQLLAARICPKRDAAVLPGAGSADRCSRRYRCG